MLFLFPFHLFWTLNFFLISFFSLLFILKFIIYFLSHSSIIFSLSFSLSLFIFPSDSSPSLLLLYFFLHLQVSNSREGSFRSRNYSKMSVTYGISVFVLRVQRFKNNLSTICFFVFCCSCRRRRRGLRK